MNNNYKDFCICSPENYEFLAKKYNEQINQKNQQKSFNSLPFISSFKENIYVLEKININHSNIFLKNNLQKIYIKTINLLNMLIKKQNTTIYNIDKKNNEFGFNKSDINFKTGYLTQNLKNNLYTIKKLSTNNLCQILNELINSQSKDIDLQIDVLDLIKLWNEI